MCLSKRTGFRVDFPLGIDHIKRLARTELGDDVVHHKGARFACSGRTADSDVTVVIGALTPIPVRHGNDLLFLLIQKSENNVAVCFGHPFNRRRQHLEKLLDFSRCHLLRGAVCFFMRIIKVPILRSARRVHLSAPIAHSDAVAEKHHRDNADRKPDIFGIIEKKSIPKTSQWVKYYRYRFLKYQSCNGLRSQPNDINDQRRQKDD